MVAISVRIMFSAPWKRNPLFSIPIVGNVFWFFFYKVNEHKHKITSINSICLGTSVMWEYGFLYSILSIYLRGIANSQLSETVIFDQVDC